MSTVFLALPRFRPEPEALVTAEWPLRPGSPHQLVKAPLAAAALLPFMFNKLWCAALNERDQRAKLREEFLKDKGKTMLCPPPPITHFAMAHDDILAEDGWLDKLLDEMERVGADVLSTVIAIKEEGGHTSTARMQTRQMFTEGPGAPLRIGPAVKPEIHRYTLRELSQGLPTFTCGQNLQLLVNTGLFVCRFDQPWVEQIHFHFGDSIKRHDDGTYHAYNMPEDWNFSLDAAKLGARVFATRVVKAEHIGRKKYPNWIEAA